MSGRSLCCSEKKKKPSREEGTQHLIKYTTQHSIGLENIELQKTTSGQALAHWHTQDVVVKHTTVNYSLLFLF